MWRTKHLNKNGIGSEVQVSSSRKRGGQGTLFGLDVVRTGMSQRRLHVAKTWGASRQVVQEPVLRWPCGLLFVVLFAWWPVRRPCREK